MKSTLLSLDLPVEIIKRVDNLNLGTGRYRSRVYRHLLNLGLSQYINPDTLEINEPIRLERSIMDRYPSRIGFHVNESAIDCLDKLCTVYPFTRKSLAEFLICQAYENKNWLKDEIGPQDGEA